MKSYALLFFKGVFTPKILAFLAMVIFSVTFSMAADRYSVANGNWNQTTTWSATSGGSPGALAPVAGDNVYIEGGFMVTTANTSNCNNLSIASGATLNVGGFILNVNGTTSLTGTINHTSTAGVKTFIGLVTINTGGVWDNSANEDINFRGGLSYSGTTFSAGTGVHTFTINNQTITGTLTIPKVTVNIVSLTNNGTLTVSTNLAGTGELINSATGILNLGGVSGITTLTATASGNTVNYTDGAQTVHNGDYFNLGLSGTGKKTLLSGTDTIGGDLIINGTSANATTVTDLLITGNLSIGDGNTFTAAGFALTVGGTTTVGAGTSGKLAISSATGAKLFTGLVTIGAGAIWSNTGNSPVEFRSGITTAQTFTGGNGIQTFSTNDQALTGIFSIPKVTVTGITLTNNDTLTVDDALEGTGGLTNAGTGTLNLDGTSGITTLTATATGNTVNYTHNIQTVHDGNYYNLILSGGFKKTLQAGTSLIGGNLTLSGISANTTTVADLTITGNLIIGDGNAFTADGFALTVDGTTTVGTGTGGVLFLTGSSGLKLFKGHVTLEAGAKWNDFGESPVEFRSGITHNGETFNSGNGLYSFTTNNQSVGGTSNISIPNLNVDAVTLTNNCATLTAGTSLEGSGGVTNTTGNTLKINGASTITTITATANNNIVAYFGDNQTVHNGAYHHLAIGGTGVKTISTADVNIINTLAIRTVATVSAPPTFSPAAILKYNTPDTRTTGVEWITPFTPTGGVIILNTGTIVLNEDKVLNSGVPLSITDATATLNVNSYNLTLGDGFNNNGTFIPDTGTVIFNGTAAQTVTGTGTTPFYNLTINNLVGVATGNGVTSVGGNFTNNGIFTPGTGTIALNGTSDQIITGTSATTFNNLIINKASGGVALGINADVNGTLTLTNGIVDGATYTLTVGPSGSVSGGSNVSYISGKLALTYTGTGSKSFPIGKGGAYRPITLQFSSLTGTSVVTAEQFESAITGTLPANATLLTTSRYWAIGQSGGSNLQYFVTLDATDYTPSRPVLILKKDAGIMVSCATATPNYTNSSSLTSFSDFGLGEACINPDDGGTIQSDQSGCPTFDPDEITGTTPTGQTGTLEYKWQSSITSDVAGFTDIDGATGSNYNPGAVTNTTWFIRLVKVDCKSDWTDCDTSNVVKITVLTNCQIFGNANYENNPKTPLNGLKVILLKGSAYVDSVQTNAQGYYSFTGLASGTYSLQIKSAHSSGQWQTWGGVNNTDYLLVSKHIANTLPLPVNPPVVKTSASVKLPHPAINPLDANAIRQAAKFPATGYTYFDTTKWVFSGIDASNSLNNITLSDASVTRDIRGLCSGDVNGTYVPPTGYKTTSPELELVNSGNLPLAQEMVFPIRASRDMELGAITLMLDFDPAQIEITGVTMPENGGVEPWFEVQSSKFKVAATLNLEPETLNFKPETLNLLQIGWMSMEPVRVAGNGTLLLIHARLTEAFQVSSVKCQIRFALNGNPLSELADGDGNVIGGEKLFIPTGGNGEMVKWRNGEIVCYPNPVKDVLNVEFVIDDVDAKTYDGVSLQLVTMQGIVVAKQNVADIKTGLNKTTMDLRDLPNGAYLLKVLYGDQSEVRKVIVNR